MNFMFIRARYNYIQLIILQRIEGKARFLYSLPFPPSSNGMTWYAMILILIAIPADANFLNGYALNGPVLVGYVLKIRIGGICIGGIRLRFLLMHTFWMDTHWMDTHSMDTYWWDTCWTDTYWWDTYCKTCWCKRFERITLHGYVLVGYVLNGYVLVGYVLVGYVLNGYVWDMCGVMDMCGICVVWDMCGICVVWDMCGICVAWDMCGICVVWDTPTIFWRTLRRNVFREKLLTYKPLESRKIKQGSPDQKIIHKQGKNWWRFHYSQVAKLSASLVDKKTPERQSREKLCKYFWDTPTLFNVEPENNDLLKAAPIEFFRILMMRRRRMNGRRIKQNINSIKKILGGDQKKVSKKNIARTTSSGTWEGRWKPLRHGGSKNITRDPRTRPT